MFEALTRVLTKKKPKTATAAAAQQEAAAKAPASDHLASSLQGDSISGGQAKASAKTGVGPNWGYEAEGSAQAPPPPGKTAVGPKWDYEAEAPAQAPPPPGKTAVGPKWGYEAEAPPPAPPQAIASHYGSAYAQDNAPPPPPQAIASHYGSAYAQDNAQAPPQVSASHYGSAYAAEAQDPAQQVAPPAPAPPTVAPPHQHDPFGLGAGPLITTPLAEEFRGEHVGMERQTGHLPRDIAMASGVIQTPTTAYASDKSVHAAPVHDGRIHFNGAFQEPVSPATSVPSARGANDGAKRAWKKDKDERLNYAMDQQSGLYLSNPNKEIQASFTPPDADGNRHGVRINHSTMLAGGDAAGAGTMKLNQGKVESMSDSSGHYKPSVTQTAQVAKTLADKGAVSPERTNIELTGKNAGEKELQLSAMELMAYEGTAGKAWGQDKNAPPPAPAPPRLRPAQAPASEARKGLDARLAARENPADAPATSFATARQKHAETGDVAHLAAPEATIRKEHAKKDQVLDQVRGFDASQLKPTAPPAALVEGRARSKRRS